MKSSRVIQSISEPQAGMVVLAILVLLIAALLGAKLAARCNIPKVAGEIIGGIILGPSVLGWILPDAYAYIFLNFAHEGQVVSVFYWLGLILLMFTSGYEARLEDWRSDRKIIGWLIAGSTVVPMLAGYCISDLWFADHYLGAAGDRVVFNLIFAIAAAVTSIPVISKIFLDLGLIRHRYAKIILTTATIQDLFLWVVLSAAGSMLSAAGADPAGILPHLVVTGLMFGFAMIAAPRLGRLGWLEKLAVFSFDSIYFILCFACVYVGYLFEVNIMYSAFVAGMIFKNIRNAEAEKAQIKIKELSLAFFTPVYFAIVGVRIHVTGDFAFWLFLAFLVAVSALELGGCVAAMRIIKLDWLTSFNFGIAMNARGGPGIVLASVTYEMGIINYEFFCALIFVTLITSTAAGWWIDFINRRGRLLAI